MTLINAVILCGGGGTRSWPKSRPDKPKPFQNLLGEITFFQSTLARLQGAGFVSLLVVSGKAHVELTSQQAGHGDLAELIVAPAAKIPLRRSRWLPLALIQMQSCSFVPAIITFRMSQYSVTLWSAVLNWRERVDTRRDSTLFVPKRFFR